MPWAGTRAIRNEPMTLGLGLLLLSVLLLGWFVAARSARTKKSSSSNAAPVQPSEALSPDPESIIRLHGSAKPPSQSPLAFVDPPREPESPSARRSESSIVIRYEEGADEDEPTSPHARILVTARGDSDCGRARHANDDSLLLLPECSLFAVADGMGGYAGGQVASSLAVETLKRAFAQQQFVGELRADKPVPRRGRELASSILQSHWAVTEAARSSPTLNKMGTTLVAARFSPNKQRVYIGHVGDSRCYRFRAGRLRQLTTDQTMGLIGLQGPRANDLLQAIGVTTDLAIDLIVDRPRANDIYLLCSDGLPKMADDGEIETILSRERDLEAAVYGLIELANDRGGKDNVTVVLIQVVEQALETLSPVRRMDWKAKGWSKLPNEVVLDHCSTEDETVVGSVPLDDPTTVGAIPTATGGLSRPGRKQPS